MNSSGSPLPSLESIDSAPTEILDNDSRASKEQSALAHEAEQFRAELGWLGRALGGKREKPGNIAIIVLLLCFVGMAFIYVRPPEKESGIEFERLYGGFTSIISLILGYLFGSNDRSGDR